MGRGDGELREATLDDLRHEGLHSWEGVSGLVQGEKLEGVRRLETHGLEECLRGVGAAHTGCNKELGFFTRTYETAKGSAEGCEFVAVLEAFLQHEGRRVAGNSSSLHSLPFASEQRSLTRIHCLSSCSLRRMAMVCM